MQFSADRCSTGRQEDIHEEAETVLTVLHVDGISTVHFYYCVCSMPLIYMVALEFCHTPSRGFGVT